ncbi:hypothetical protein ACH5RR_009239 [Cinchona calisaya]|uniref:Uncharacterized protein n=1 Tax=Cinchona calisaya TaxID=153742 RepID=A0ABD3ADV6_9GENT
MVGQPNKIEPVQVDGDSSNKPIHRKVFDQQEDNPKYTIAIRRNGNDVEISTEQPKDITIPFPFMHEKNENDFQFLKFFEFLRKLHVNIPFIDVLEQILIYAKFMNEILAKKWSIKRDGTIMLTEECRAAL